MEASSNSSKKSNLSTAQQTRAITDVLREWLSTYPGIELHEQDYHFNRGDLVAVKPGGSITEYEVKSDKSDLSRELRIIRDVVLTGRAEMAGTALVRHLNQAQLPDEDYRRLVQRFCVEADTSKWRKHAWYLDKYATGKKPNYFFVAVPPQRAVTAFESLADTPYGLVSVDIDRPRVTILKIASPL